jgi:hypothetical protein
MSQLDPARAIRLCDGLLRLFGRNGEHWIRGAYHDGRGAFCLVGAIDHLHYRYWSGRFAPDGSGQYLSAAIWPRRIPHYRPEHLVEYNDSCTSFEQLRAVIVKARALARRDVNDPNIARDNAYAAEKEKAAAARKRQLVAEIERERMVRHAAGDTRETYILGPRAPEPATPERLAA